MNETVHTFCRICLCTCGIDVEVDTVANKVLNISPDRENPYTWGDFCRKGKTANQTAEHPRRITSPLKRVGDSYVEATYDEAIQDIARRLNEIIERDGPDAVGSYHGSPMGAAFGISMYWIGLLDAIGTRNRYWVGSVDQNDFHVVADAMYGSDLISLVPDIDSCDCFLLIGMDPAVSKFNWVDNCPQGWQRIRDRQRRGADVIVVDPRLSVTASQAGTHVPILPGQDWAFLLGLIKVIFQEGLERISPIIPMDGIDALRSLAAEVSLDNLALLCGISTEVLRDVGRRFARAETAMAITHTGVAHNMHGTLGEWLGHALNLVTNRVDVPGGRRYERGVAPMDKILTMFAPANDHFSRLRNMPTVAGFHSLAELPDEITTPGAGQIKAFLMAFGNPVLSGPDGEALDGALQKLDLLVSVDLFQRESHRHADWLIPGTHWLEREELHPVLAGIQEKPYIQFGRRAVERPTGVMEEWEFFGELAIAMRRDLFDQRGVNSFIRLSRWVARATRRPSIAVNPEWMQRLLVAWGRRVKWRDIMAHPHGYRFADPTYGDLAAAIATPNKRVQVAPAPFIAACKRALAVPRAENTQFPFVLINKRHREAMNSQFHDLPGLFRAGRDMGLEMHSSDARRIGVGLGDHVIVSSATGAVETRVTLNDGLRPGVVCLPHGWGGRLFDPMGSAEPLVTGVNRNLLADGVGIDPISQTPAFNTVAVKIDLLNRAGTREKPIVSSPTERPDD